MTEFLANVSIVPFFFTVKYFHMLKSGLLIR
uniref:Uncharacterized protein n=1 Tax=Anguilla anguilla TaxID=7936 RepID=A0A0E9WD60_ANGAN